MNLRFWTCASFYVLMLAAGTANAEYVVTGNDTFADGTVLTTTGNYNKDAILMDMQGSATLTLEGALTIQDIRNALWVKNGNLTLQGGKDSVLTIDQVQSNIQVYNPGASLTFKDIDFNLIQSTGQNAQGLLVKEGTSFSFINTKQDEGLRDFHFGVVKGRPIESHGDFYIKGADVYVNPLNTSQSVNSFAGSFIVEDSNFVTTNAGHGYYTSASTFTDPSAKTVFSSSTGEHTAEFSNNKYAGLLLVQRSAVYFKDMNINVIENGNDDVSPLGMQVSSGGGVLNIEGNGKNTLTLKDNFGAGIGTWASFNTSTDEATNGKDYIVNVSGMNIISENNTAFLTHNGGTFNISNSHIETKSDDYVFRSEDGGYWGDRIYADNGYINLDNIHMSGVSTKLYQNIFYEYGKKDMPAYFNVKNSYVIGAINDQALGNTNLVNTQWKMLGNSQVYNFNMDKNTQIDMRHPTTGNNNQFVITGHYNSNGGTIFMNTNVGTADETDLIVLEDGAKATGQTNLHITNTRALRRARAATPEASQDGTMIVQAKGSATTDVGSFVLNGDKIDDGAYAYRLYRGDRTGVGHSHYLRKTDEVTNVAASIINVPAVHISMMMTDMNELRNRLGQLREGSADHDNGLWVRSYAKDLHVHDKIKNTMNLYGGEAGYDYTFYQTPENRLLGGAMFGYAYGDKIRIHQVENDQNGHGDTDMFSIGGYLTWLNKDGWFADAVARYYWARSNLTNLTAQGEPVTYKADRGFIAASLEAGKRFEFSNSPQTAYVLEPKVQAVYAYAPDKSYETNLQDEIKYGQTNSFVTRASLMGGYKMQINENKVVEPFLQLGLAQQWNGKTNVRYDTYDFESDVHGTTYEFIGGVNAQLGTNFNVYADIMVETGRIYKSLGAHLGVRSHF